MPRQFLLSKAILPASLFVPLVNWKDKRNYGRKKKGIIGPRWLGYKTSEPTLKTFTKDDFKNEIGKS